MEGTQIHTRHTDQACRPAQLLKHITLVQSESHSAGPHHDLIAQGYVL